MALLPVEGQAPGICDGVAQQGVAAHKLQHLAQLEGADAPADLHNVHQQLGVGKLPQPLVQRTHLGSRDESISDY